MEHAELYAQSNSNQYKDNEKILQEYKNKLNWVENEQILDIGCGTGNTTVDLILPIIPKSASLTGIDISKDMIKFAQKTYKNDKLRFTTLDIAADNVTEILGNETFNKIFSFYCLHWIPDQRKAAENIWKLLKTGGMALIVFIAKSSLFSLYKWLSEQPKWKEYMLDVNNYASYQDVQNPCEIYSELLHATGFKVIECYEKETSVNARTIKELEKALKAVNPFINRMPIDIQGEYMNCLMNKILDHNLVKTNESEPQNISYIKPNQLLITYCQKIS
ncbi:juvenile hormone acid methyltransferase [Lycorma delicatula]|uniref:juvenile hormone acid methyltransferase n=1 Tax=Lycorma delicatula TaxID=130591 RepID=UPI003F51A217